MSPEESKSNPERVKRFEKVWQALRNPISLTGAALALVSLANILFLFLIDVLSTTPSPYVGILAYMVAPGFLILGLLIVAVGAWWDARRRRTQVPGEPVRYLRLDFNDPTQRGTIAFFFSFTIVFILMSVVGSYKAYEFTDSVQLRTIMPLGDES